MSINDIIVVVICGLLGGIAGNLIGMALYKLYVYIKWRRG